MFITGENAQTDALFYCWFIHYWEANRSQQVLQKNMEDLLFAAIVYAFPGTYNTLTAAVRKKKKRVTRVKRL